MSKQLAQVLADLGEQEALSMVRERLRQGEDPFSILDDARRGMEIVGERFEKNEYFIPELIYSGEILNQIADIIKPEIKGEAEKKKGGKVIIGTVAGDIHDIGKNIVTFMLDVNGFEVYDLGVDVPAQVFIDKIKETGAGVVGLSGFLTLAYDSMKETVNAISEAGLRDKVKIMIGGGMINEDIRQYAGADGYGDNAMAGVNLSKQWLGGK
jgi:methanogenic corrinoid protein MtbC1